MHIKQLPENAGPYTFRFILIIPRIFDKMLEGLRYNNGNVGFTSDAVTSERCTASIYGGGP